MSPVRPVRRGGVLGLALVGGYAVSVAAAGVLVAVTAGPGTATAGAPAEPVLREAAVLAPLGAGGRPAQPDARTDPTVPIAPEGRTAAGQLRPFRPTRLVLPGGASAAIVAVGVHEDGSMVIPEDPRQVGWWNGGALAGDAFGSVVVAGHVDSRRLGLGVMAGLRTVEPGQVVQLAAGRRTLRYRVVSTDRVRQARLAGDTDVFRQDVPPRLVLITCGGAFDPVRHRYTDNLVIVAEPVR